jgi:hypothetical protein
MVSSASCCQRRHRGQRLGRARGDQRRVAVQDQGGAVLVVQHGHGLLHGVAGAQLRLLAHEVQRGLRKHVLRQGLAGQGCSTLGKADFMRVPLPRP